MQKEYSKEIPKVILNTYPKFSEPQWELIKRRAASMAEDRDDYVLHVGKLCNLLLSLGEWVNKEMKKLEFREDGSIDEANVPVIFIPGVGKFIGRHRVISLRNIGIKKNKLKALENNGDNTEV